MSHITDTDKMARFRNVTAQKDFIKDTNGIHHFMMQLIPVEKRDLVVQIGNNYLTKWKQIFEISVDSEFNIEHMFTSEQTRIYKMYEELKESLIADDRINKKYSHPNNMNDCIIMIESLKREEKGKLVETRLIQFQIGLMLYNLKIYTKTQKMFKLMTKRIGYSASYAYKLIRLYSICTQFPSIRYTSFPLQKLLDNFEDMLEFIERNVNIWAPPPNPTTPILTSTPNHSTSRN